MTCGVTMVKYRGRGLLVFLEPFCKSSHRLSNIFFLTPMFTAFVSIYDFTFVGNRIFVLESHKESFDGLSSFKVNLYPKLVACLLHLGLDDMGPPCISFVCCCFGQCGFGFFLFYFCLDSGFSFLLY